MELKPVIKYAGGKRQIINTIIQYFPKEFNDYYEPFIGGGSVLFELQTRKLIKKKIYISDTMDSLINMYITIKEHCTELIDELSRDTVYKNTKTCYIEGRKRFNELKVMTNLTQDQTIEYAALFIYLNKTCFNGMYRENKKGHYNVSFGKQKNPKIYDDESIQNLSNFLKMDTINIKCEDYMYIETYVKGGDFIYMDPPYYGTFTGYTKTQFDKESHKNLRDLFVRLTERGCKIALSNSEHEYIRDLYGNIPNVKIKEIPVKRVINSKVKDRCKQITELLITNY